MLCRKKKLSIIIAACLDMTVVMHAQAADQDAQEKLAKSESVHDLKEVTVTSTHKVQSVQKVPIHVDVIDGEKLKALNSSDISSIQYLAPGISYSMDVAADGGGFKVRGIGTQSYNYGTEQTVGTVVDDVIISLPRDPGAGGFSDVERIEVLRGPQGTLFGKNASAGVVSIITKNPDTSSDSADIHMAVGSRNEQVAQVNGNLVVSDNSALRISGYYQKQDGAVSNIYNSWNAGDLKNSGIRAKYLWDINDKLSVLLTAEHQNIFTRSPYLVYSLGTDSSYNALLSGYKVDGSQLLSFANEDWYAWTRTSGTSAKVDYKSDWGDITSITAFRKMNLVQVADIDLSPANYVDNSETRNNDRQLSQEFRLSGDAFDGRLDYVLGAFYSKTSITANELKYGAYTYDADYVPTFLYLRGAQGIAHYLVNTKSSALFGSTTYAINEKLSSIVGARLTHDSINARFSVYPVSEIDGLPTVALATKSGSYGSTSKSNVSGKVGLQYQHTQDVMSYATVSQGYKGPSVDVLSGTANKIKPETSINYEVGIKSKFFDRRLTLNADLYWDIFHDFQATALNYETMLTQLTNADKMRTRGAELDTSFSVTPNLTLSANAAYTDAEFLSYISSCPSPGSLPCYTVSGVSVANFKGQRPAYSSKYSAALQAAYQHGLGDNLSLDMSGGWSWRSSFYNAIGQEQTMTGSYGIVNGTVGIGSSDGRWRVGVYARNLFDKRYRAYIISTAVLNPYGLDQQFASDSFRTVGLSLDMKF
ncbi:TonB-dependent receptor [Pseudoxanthomonas sp.]|uniref:TonB-dependent receptor n=1 Tax=Pseudoxanthomonas sp. TaxID=1871049 RepID=UPI00263809AB|nr:TonB-dependent receptor [Pseudoxanthomonas sp.]WDS35440.1 MAG: TonB-dependent receptor [Pseudoxanthomonas sp.]